MVSEEIYNYIINNNNNQIKLFCKKNIKSLNV